MRPFDELLWKLVTIILQLNLFIIAPRSAYSGMAEK